MRLAVTGGSGRIGRYTIDELLAHGHEVRNLDRSAPENEKQKCPFVRVDMTDLDEVAAAIRGCDGVIHMAAIIGPNQAPAQVVYANNTVGNYNVLQAASALGIGKVCMASSVNAIGLSYSASPTFDYFPLDEKHPARAEDCYSLSKWCGEQQADAFARLHRDMTLVSLRFHGAILPGAYGRWRDQPAEDTAEGKKALWAYTDVRDAARANRLAVEATWTGHRAFFITAQDTRVEMPSLELARSCYPNVPVRGDLSGNKGFFLCQEAHEWLGWEHEHSWRTSD